MELVPTLGLGWLNGWILLCLFYLVYGILLKVFPKDVVARLYDKSGRTRAQKALIIVGALLAVACSVLVIFTPLIVGAGVFSLGIVLFALGLAGFVFALFNFKDTPLDQWVTRGLYRVSRNPQEFAFTIAFSGMCVAVGSWLALFMLVASRLFLHFRILAEERACLERYGDSYRSYMKRVPRYFLFF